MTSQNSRPKQEVPTRPATGSELHKLVMAFRRNGHTASFGNDVDDKVKQR